MDEKANIPNNAEIDKALKEFEAESDNKNISKTPEASKTPSQNKVEGVTFEAPSYKAVKYYNETNTPKIVKLVMKYSGIKEERQAEYILLAFVVLAVLVSIYLFFKAVRHFPPPPADQIIKIAGPQGGN